MPAPFTNTDLKSTNKPAALLEMAFSLQSSELAVPVDTRPNNVAITLDAETQVVTVTATLPFTYTLDSTGKPVITATDYIP